MQQAWEHLLQVLTLSGSDPAEELKGRVQSNQEDASVVRIVSVIMMALVKSTDINKDKGLRALIQPHLKELRALVGKDKEAEVMGKALHIKVQQVLAMRC
eukprot:6492061-Amphidinium_carterae.2